MLTKEEILKKYFGYDAFYPIQSNVIDNVLAGKDNLVLMPTGGGKSVCYQVPALMLPGLTVVVSPLIALMRDQVRGLKANGIRASFLNSSLTSGENEQVALECAKGIVKILYVSPEKLLGENFIAFLKTLNISLIAIDEAHCISFWGHDFRPEYQQLGKVKDIFPNTPILALTATADKVIRRDILSQLQIPDDNIFIASFDRPNLSLTVRSGRQRMQQIIDFLKQHPNESGIIYCITRATTQDVAERLQKMGYKAKHYHAGIGNTERSKIQDEFLKDDIQIICATIAFGMGIDKSNIRWVIHYNLPKNLESFYQEIGRAGRDGAPADTLLFYTWADVITHTSMLNDVNPERKELLEAKLERMRRYAESEICRRKILISYFNETFDKECGNCDVCKNPPKRLDATVIAQKALSAIARTNESINMTTLIEILRGSLTKPIAEKKYNLLKTFGVGKDMKHDEWAEYIFQMLNSGYVDIAYDEGNTYKLNPLSWKLLKNEVQAWLVKPVLYKAKDKVEKEQIALPKQQNIEEQIFLSLKQLRKSLADEQGVMAFQIFSDKSLQEMALYKPTTKEDMLEISGVGEFKFDTYGNYFLEEIKKLCLEKQILVTPKIHKPKNNSTEKTAKNNKFDTFATTWEQWEKGLTVEQIAQQRGLAQSTIIGHLVKFIEQGKIIDISKIIDDNNVQEIIIGIKEIGVENFVFKPLFEHLNGKYDYGQLKLVEALMRTGKIK